LSGEAGGASVGLGKGAYFVGAVAVACCHAPPACPAGDAVGQVLGWGMTTEQAPRVVSASREIAAGPGPIFELIADPAAQPRWDGNDNLAAAPAGQRVRRTGDVFTMTLTHGGIRENHDHGRQAPRLTRPARRPRRRNLTARRTSDGRRKIACSARLDQR